ncbi:hypothetical protein O4160_24115 [Rhodococcus sp. IEGM 1401]|uniref:hypothetical protein n=1 Tax=unclassified Rhodococcus (in: high G+C Gram-positive bacteria) TaxID=192944 RepID=UPI0022B50821|nr:MULTISPECIES: hypothetical protein [unclassified Rhodococcus (in: high G+C Gram-positive bacteria)]MCZ4563932.1 hypothetical protein [Rhodococcus sp. IEGM 1401]MDI9924054.1 hypothetical protein [Rhodococcus sp. IEGM 1372]MDV8036521.1 hypothetical protein [Rhodococcus sp. IEGM 1414]
MITNPSVEQFRRLAQSSPWLWESVEFELLPTRHTLSVHAWIRRPGNMRVEDANGKLVERVGAGIPYAGMGVQYSNGAPRQLEGRWPSDTTPTFDSDGLVSALPSIADSWLVDYDDPFYENYQWIAMLNPIEVTRSGHDHSSTETVTELSEVRAVEHHGRPAWQATVVTTDRYDARCECCALLSGHYDSETRHWVPGPPVTVRLDVQTGICVYVGPPVDQPTAEPDLDLTIIAVDARMNDSLFVHAGR